jgi:hypothetical protein
MRRNVFTLASNELEREIITMWCSAGYRLCTIERRIGDKRRIYRRLGRNERESQIARKLTFENIRRVAQYEARCRPGDRKLNVRVIMASLRAWANALRALGKPIPVSAAERRSHFRRLSRSQYTSMFCPAGRDAVRTLQPRF